ncbi:50S ribosomal protein 5, chloroplastic [Neltuma alba]|uniref:50S ribosomal protein 5, chloroplastic n=1 Tax=Neltuma alba TaxID=207710 RepID=UPI0010A379E7|nr:50S ribosomal protein 5, chloroplastic-like [Prosopis alba]
MTLLSFNSCTLASSLRFPCSTSAVAPPTVSRFHVRPVDVPSKFFGGVRKSPAFPFRRAATFVVRADSADADGAASADEGGSPPQGTGEVVPVDKLTLESKLREREEQRLRMKMAKKIRLRRKRLVRKRRMRKKGRWPPSKMKKLKNV